MCDQCDRNWGGDDPAGYTRDGEPVWRALDGEVYRRGIPIPVAHFAWRVCMNDWTNPLAFPVGTDGRCPVRWNTRGRT
jgi:hypothetical protein